MPTISKIGSSIISKIRNATSCIMNTDFTCVMTEFIFIYKDIKK